MFGLIELNCGGGDPIDAHTNLAKNQGTNGHGVALHFK